jgi:hypothetical protein
LKKGIDIRITLLYIVTINTRKDFEMQYIKFFTRPESLYLAVPEDRLKEAEKEFEEALSCDYADKAEWSNDRRARIPGVAIHWDDRYRAGLAI